MCGRFYVENAWCAVVWYITAATATDAVAAAASVQNRGVRLSLGRHRRVMDDADGFSSHKYRRAH